MISLGKGDNGKTKINNPGLMSVAFYLSTSRLVVVPLKNGDEPVT